jgi:hypothetical protein
MKKFSILGDVKAQNCDIRPRPLSMESRGTGRARSRGIASIETVIFLPLLILIFAGIKLVHSENIALLQARSQARSCAWQTSANGCEETPPGCETGTYQAETSSSAGERLERAGVLDDLRGSESVSKEIEDRLDGLLVQRTTSTATVQYRIPRLFVPEEERHSEEATEHERTAEYRLPCNSKPSHAKDLADSLWEELSR